MTSPKVEKQRQVVCTNSQAARPKTASSTTAPLLSFKNTQNNTGLSIEHTAKPNQQYVQSYVRVKSKDGKTYNFNATLEKRINNVTAKLQKAEKENGLIGKAWSWTKNTIGFGDSSNKVREIQANERKLLAQFNSNEKTRANVFKQLTGCEYNEENLEKFIKGQIKLKSEIAIQKYKEGQDMVVDVVADVGAGIAAGVALAAAPVTGGASLLLAAGVGGVTKLAIKATSAGIRGKDYSGKDIIKDIGTGAITGLLTPVTMGVGGAVGNVSTRIGARVFGQSAAGKIATKATTFLFREGSIGAIFGGGAEGLGEVGRQGYHAVADGESFDFGTIYEKTKEGAFGGAVAGVLMSGGIKITGKIGKSAGQKLHIIKKNEVLENELKELELFKNRTVELIDNQPYFHKIYKYQSRQTGFDKFVGIKERIDRYNLIKLFENKEFCKLYKSIVEDSNGRNIENKLKEKITSAFCSCMQRLDSKLNLELVETIMKDKSISNKEILKILDSINKSNQKLANILYKEGQKNFENKCSILIHANSDEKAKLAEKLFLNKDLKIKQENIWEILYHSYNIEFTDKLCSDITIPRESIINILEKYVPSLTDKLCFDKNLNFPKNLIVDVLENIDRNTNLSTAELLCSRNNFNFPTKLIPEALESCRWNYEAGKSKIIECLCSGGGLKTQTLKNEEYYDYALSFIKTFDESKASQILDRYIKYVNEMPNDKFLAVVKSVVNEELSLEETACMNALKTILGDNSTSAVLTARLLSEKKLYSLLLDNRIFNFNTVEFTKFVESVSFEEIAKFAPIVKNYTPMEKLEFLKLHFLLGTKKVTPSRLSEPYLTQYLQKNPVYRDKMAEILNALPLTNRHIGKLPTEWFVNVPSNKSISKVEILVQKYIDNLVKEINHYKYDNSNIAKQANFQSIQKFKMVMSKLLNTTVEIKGLGVGLYGAGYKITIGNSTPIVLKVFERTRPRANNYHKSTFAWSQKYIDYSRGEHGMKSETQLGLFTNNNSENFVKMYFGKVCGEHNNDGYLITEFMSRGQGGDCCAGKYGYSSNPMYTIGHHDLNEENIIGGKIIDFGGIEIIQN